MQTQRLTLRPLRGDDADWIARDIARPEVLRWLTTPPFPYRFSDAEAFIARHATSGDTWAVMDVGDPLGVISLTTDRHGVPTLGFWLKTTAWGKGYMTEAAQAVITHHFAGSTQEIRSGWIEGNYGSQRVHEKLGFKVRDALPTHSHFHGCEVPVVQAFLPPPGPPLERSSV